MLKIGNLFELAEKRLKQEQRPYNNEDIIDYAVKIRKWLDKNEKIINKFTALTEKQKKFKIKMYRRNYYLTKGV